KMRNERVEHKPNRRLGPLLCWNSPPALRRPVQIHRGSHRPLQVVENDPASRPQQHVHEDKAEPRVVPHVAAVEIAKVELRPWVGAHHSSQVPRIRPLGQHLRDAMRKLELRQDDVDARSSLHRLRKIHGGQMPSSEVFQNRSEVGTALAVIKAHLEDVSRAVLHDEIAQKRRLTMVHVGKVIEFFPNSFEMLHRAGPNQVVKLRTFYMPTRQCSDLFCYISRPSWTF